MHFDLLEGGLDLLIRRKVQQCQQTGAPPADVTISQAGARYQAIAAAAPVAAVSAAGR
jgi:hypothetical protein